MVQGLPSVPADSDIWNLSSIPRAPSNTRLVVAFLWAYRLTALLPLLMGVVVFAGGWLADSEILKRLTPNTGRIKANTAVGLMVAAGALLLDGESKMRRWRSIAWLCAALLTLIGGLSWAEYILGTNLGIDELLFRDSAATLSSHPGRPAVLTAASFYLLGASLLLRNTPRTLLSSQCLASFVAILNLGNLIGYVYGLQGFIAVPFYRGFAIPHVSIALLMLCASSLLSRPQHGIMNLLSSKAIAGDMVRRLLPVAVWVPVLLGWLMWRGELAGYYGTAFGLSLFTSANIVVFALLIWLYAVRLNHVDFERLTISEQMHRAELVRVRQEALQQTFLHDLMNHAGAVEGVSRELADEEMSPEERSEFVGMLSISARSLVEEIRSHRTLIAAEKGELTVKRTACNSLEALRSAAAACRAFGFAEDKQIAVLPGAQPIIFQTDTALLGRVLINMLKNALEASSLGATVSADCRISSPGRVCFSVHNEAVMPDDMAAHVFQRFFSTKGTGRGLGTYSIKLLTEQYLDGHASFESTAGLGTTFRAEFAIEPAALQVNSSTG
ncbi:MAG TPA: HAMP domain-containing sensor histidine kinase [Bryobacteraceae bacterium]|nr:HAMP domain-containing sensor histidine kinase [Bryobacteraceae bacterium]